MFFDKLSLSVPRKTADGYLLARSRATRIGVADYLGSELGRPDMARVAVYRPESEVFDQASVASFIGKPITDNHPSVPVTAANWSDYAKGFIGSAMRDGDFLAFDLALMDGATIDSIDAGKRELSLGYSGSLSWTPGTAPDGQHYDAVIGNLRGNHCAVVGAARMGSSCRIGDAAICAAGSVALFDAKPPKSSIDEALKAKFAERAKKYGVSVKEMLSGLPADVVSQIAAEVAAEFVTQHAQHGVANQFSSQFGR